MNPYLNFFFILSLVIGIPGALLLLKNIFGLFVSQLKRRRWESYVKRSSAAPFRPGEKRAPEPVDAGQFERYRRGLRRCLGFVVLAFLLLLPGLYLLRFTSFVDAAGAGKLRSFRDTPGHLVVMIQAPGKEWVTTGSMPGNYWAVRGQFIVFDRRLRYIGLFAYQRVEGVETIRAKEDLFVQGRVRSRSFVPQDAVFKLLLKYNGKIPMVKVFEQTTVHRPPSDRDVDFMAARTGYVLLG